MVRFLVLIFAALLPAAVAAENPAPCKDDVAKFCSAVLKEGKAGVGRCLMQHQADLSAECRERVQQRKQEGKEMIQACRADAEKLCANVERGGGRIMRCLKEKEKELSAECKDALSRQMERRNRPAQERRGR